MVRARTLALLLGAAAGAVAVVRHGGTALGRRVPGGILIGDAGAYDRLSGFLLGSLYGSIAADVASVVPAGGRVLEVGCGPGHLSIRLADQHGFDVTGLDLDPVMIERARAKVAHGSPGDERRPAFVVGDAATLPFPDGSFDVVVSTLSMHHWADPVAGLTEIGRVLRAGGRALVWDFRPGAVPFHPGLPDPLERTHGAPLEIVSATPWPWPWRVNLVQRIELSPALGVRGH